MQLHRATMIQTRSKCKIRCSKISWIYCDSCDVYFNPFTDHLFVNNVKWAHMCESRPVKGLKAYPYIFCIHSVNDGIIVGYIKQSINSWHHYRNVWGISQWCTKSNPNLLSLSWFKKLWCNEFLNRMIYEIQIHCL